MKRNALIFIVFGLIGLGIEVMFTSITKLSLFGVSSWVMFPVYGLGGLWIGQLNERGLAKKFNVHLQAIIGVIIIYALEFVSGLVINKAIGLNVWDYSNLPLNIYGQITLLFVPLWYIAAYSTIIIDDKIRH